MQDPPSLSRQLKDDLGSCVAGGMFAMIVGAGLGALVGKVVGWCGAEKETVRALASLVAGGFPGLAVLANLAGCAKDWRRLWILGRLARKEATANRMAVKPRVEPNATAFHEAAHFVLMDFLDPGSAGRVTIVQQGWRCGSVKSQFRVSCNNDIIGLCAGYWAEVLIGQPASAAEAGARSDLVKAELRLAATGLDFEARRSLAADLLGHSLMLVIAYWGPIRTLAAALQEAGTLDAEAAARVVLHAPLHARADIPDMVDRALGRAGRIRYKGPITENLTCYGVVITRLGEKLSVREFCKRVATAMWAREAQECRMRW